jgi:hypothetical protein
MQGDFWEYCWHFEQQQKFSSQALEDAEARKKLKYVTGQSGQCTWHRVNLQWQLHNILLKGFQEVYATQHVLHLFTYFSSLTHLSIFSPSAYLCSYDQPHIQKYAHCCHRHSFPSLHHIAFTLHVCHTQNDTDMHIVFLTQRYANSHFHPFFCVTILFPENTVKCRLTTGIRSEKCVVRRFRRCANVIECTYTNLDSTV